MLFFSLSLFFFPLSCVSFSSLFLYYYHFFTSKQFKKNYLIFDTLEQKMGMGIQRTYSISYLFLSPNYLINIGMKLKFQSCGYKILFFFFVFWILIFSLLRDVMIYLYFYFIFTYQIHSKK